jgi:hypothetical protein
MMMMWIHRAQLYGSGAWKAAQTFRLPRLVAEIQSEGQELLLTTNHIGTVLRVFLHTTPPRWGTNKRFDSLGLPITLCRFGAQRDTGTTDAGPGPEIHARCLHSRKERAAFGTFSLSLLPYVHSLKFASNR